jgi:serine/threonine-protein kinase
MGVAAASLPRHLGRYEVVGFLASGGMAEVLLARIVGPSGFERAVVLKRVLPHLARQSSFVDMFLDEARIIARIRHPNVVQVQELVREGPLGELLLVMEYLEGESLASLTRRLASLGESMEPTIAAHIVAEACAGLHAAHELVDDGGVPLGIVHRDVSPQNIFVTFDGAVKVIDFGIAMSHGRATRTEVGQLKGKYSYMSPEQAAAAPLDRRCDIFALGIVFYELLVGRRLFHRATPLATLKAITRLPILPPSRIAPECPKAFERIALRSLARARDERYPSAAEMRRDLVAAVHDAPSSALPEERLATLMKRVFADRREEKAEMLRRVRVGSSITSLPVAEVDDAIEIPSVVAEDIVGEEIDTVGPRATRRRSPWPLRGALAFVAVAAAAAGFAIHARLTRTTVAVAAPHVTPPAVAALPAPAPTEVRIDIDSIPSGAEVVIAGEHRGRTPLTLRLPHAEQPLPLSLRRDGFAPLSDSLTPNLDQRLRLPLTPAPTAAAARPHPHPHGTRSPVGGDAPKPVDPINVKW